MKFRMMLIFLILGLSFIYAAQVEVGKVDWRRDHDAVLAESSETGKPDFALFQEVPGCAGCKKFGRDVLSYPELVEVIESAFIPLLIYNNQESDREFLKSYEEPAWNYQVVRFLDGKGRDIIPPQGSGLDASGTERADDRSPAKSGSRTTQKSGNGVEAYTFKKRY